VIENRRRHSTITRSRSSRGYKPPALEAVLWQAAQSQPAPPATSHGATPNHGLSIDRTFPRGPVRCWADIERNVILICALLVVCRVQVLSLKGCSEKSLLRSLGFGILR
jgi:hypothetical protein